MQNKPKPIKQETLEIIKIIAILVMAVAIMAGILVIKGQLNKIISIEYSNCVNHMYNVGNMCTTEL